jgi:hypothetical protein
MTLGEEYLSTVIRRLKYYRELGEKFKPGNWR